MKAYRIIITGEVQGIGYRYFTRVAANRLGIFGWVRNCPDGSVEIHGEGDDASLSRFIEDVRKGPAELVLDTFTVTETPPDYFYGFEIRC